MRFFFRLLIVFVGILVGFFSLPSLANDEVGCCGKKIGMNGDLPILQCIKNSPNKDCLLFIDGDLTCTSSTATENCAKGMMPTDYSNPPKDPATYADPSEVPTSPTTPKNPNPSEVPALQEGSYCNQGNGICKKNSDPSPCENLGSCGASLTCCRTSNPSTDGQLKEGASCSQGNENKK